ncbi:MAG: hypothetical protein EPN53_03220 [Acidobacteria bacterium]|nr:MAG: hypothetical protein EPN53_03220 [Acidobacteriota bacterium]
MMRKVLQGTLVVVASMLANLPASAAVVGNWNSSLRTWNNVEMANLKGIVTTAGHTVLADAAITAGLGGATVYVVGEGTVAPTAGELTILENWVAAGGRLLLFNNSGCSGCTATTAILTALSSSISVSGTSAVAAPFPTSPFTTTPNNLVGLTLVTSPGDEVVGGTQIAGSFISYQAHGAGYVFVFGDRSDHNIFNSTATDINAQLFLNILAGGVPAEAIPAVGLLGLLILFACVAAAGFLILRTR